MNESLKAEARNLEIDIEKKEVEANILKNEVKNKENDNLRMRDSFSKIERLKTVIEDYSLTLSEDDLLDSIIKNVFLLFQDAQRVLLYLVDTEKQGLRLVRSMKRDHARAISAKNGDIFDRWVLKHMLPLMVEDARKDFRFSLKDVSDGLSSLIACPIMSERNIYGILRVDSTGSNRFSQSDMRFLDIISDVSNVSIQNAVLYKKVQELAIRDSLTGLCVHRYFIERLEKEVGRSLRSSSDFSLLMLDLDDFKGHNDKYGHTSGDLILKHLTSIILSVTQHTDIVARYGGEEFAIILLNKGKTLAVKVAEEIRDRLSKAPLIVRRHRIDITVSIGVASCPSEARIAKDILKLADVRLYKAKEDGKNKVCFN
ncbi:MAG: sensor domain-containing diguanylate cyclase [Candidatus Omnitrophota bacterium]